MENRTQRIPEIDRCLDMSARRHLEGDEDSAVILTLAARLMQKHEQLKFNAAAPSERDSDPDKWLSTIMIGSTPVTLERGLARSVCAELSKLEEQNAALGTRISQFQFCINRVAEALGNVCCGGVDSTPETQLSDPHSTTRVLCDAIKKLKGKIPKWIREERDFVATIRNRVEASKDSARKVIEE